MHTQSITPGVLRPLSACTKGRCALTASLSIRSGIFQIPSPANRQRTSLRFLSAVGAESDRTGMAETVLSKPHRFILVSDLDWTMVRIASLASLIWASLICTQS